MFLTLFCKHLPCPKCRHHANEYLESHMTYSDLDSRENIVKFLNDLHNDVNKRLGRRQVTLREHYEIVRGNERPPLKSNGVDLTLNIVCIILLIALFIKLKRKESGNTV